MMEGHTSRHPQLDAIFKKCRKEKKGIRHYAYPLEESVTVSDERAAKASSGFFEFFKSQFTNATKDKEAEKRAGLLAKTGLDIVRAIECHVYDSAYSLRYGDTPYARKISPIEKAWRRARNCCSLSWKALSKSMQKLPKGTLTARERKYGGS